MLKSRILAATLLACLSLVALPAVAQDKAADGRIIVKTQDDLPRFTYQIDMKPSELLATDDATFNAFASRVEADIDDMLAKYLIEDKATMRSVLDLKGKIALLKGNDSTAMKTIGQERALEEKPDAKLTNGLREEAMIHATEQAHASSGEVYELAYASYLESAVSQLPWDVVGTNLKSLKRSALIAGTGRLIGTAQADFDPTYEANDGSISQNIGASLIYMRYSIDRWVPVADETAQVLTKHIAANDVRKPDIWEAREVTLAESDDLTPVVVAIWDSGVDLDLFPGRVYTGATPTDTTGESGIAFDLLSMPELGDLQPLTDAQQARYPAMQDDMKGLSDLQNSIDSPEADAVAARIANLKPEETEDYLETLRLFGNYSHGTHVAGIAARGNPAIRLVYGRMTFSWETMPPKPTVELAERSAAAMQAYVDWFKKNNVRVVNMSWGGSPAGYEPALEKHGMGKDAQERKAMARRLFEIGRDALFAAIKGAPDILFVTAAGNSDSSNSFDESMPSSFVLPNMLTVGAVDQAGDETGFTSYGENVVVHANGFEVPSYVPGGRTLAKSGTSMASPNVANLAAKLIALDPSLTPVEVKKIIVETATPTDDGRRNNINPKAAVAMLESGI